MDEKTDFSLEPADEKATEETPAAQAPVIVIEYRQRGIMARLMPPALIFIAAIAISSYQRTNSVRQLLPRVRTPQAVASPEPATEKKEEPKVVVHAANRAELAEQEKKREEDLHKAVALTTEPQPTSSAAPVVVAEAVTETPFSPFDLDPADGLKPVPMVDVPASSEPPKADPVASKPASVDEPSSDSNPGTPTADRTPPVVSPFDDPVASDTKPDPSVKDHSKEEILKDIQRESEQKEAAREELADVKPRARAFLLAESLNRVHSDRVPFRNDLRKVLQEMGDGAGSEIDAICDEHGRTMLPEVRNAYDRLRRLMPSRMSRQEKIDMMRSVGIPEPVLLDFLANGLHKTMKSRGGPRDEDQVRVQAARALLAIPLPSAKKTTSTASPVSTRAPAH